MSRTADDEHPVVDDPCATDRPPPGPAQAGDGFAKALRAALAASGLSLDRVQHRLRTRGVVVSLATLSYWQNGRRHPGRADSLAVLSELEAVLGLRPNELRRLAGAPRPRGRAIRHQTMDPHDLWRFGADFSSTIEELDLEWDAALTRLALCDRVTVGADGREKSIWSRQTLRAERDGPDRIVVAYRFQEGAQIERPRLSVIRGAAAGPAVHNAGLNLIATELLLERPLKRGEHAVVEYEVEHPEPGPISECYTRVVRLPTRMCVVEAEFDPACPPDLVERIVQPVDGDAVNPEDDDQAEPVELEQGFRAIAVAVDVAACSVGFRWGMKAAKDAC